MNDFHVLGLEVDGEGVVRVVECEGGELTLTARELGLILTALLKAVLATSEGDDTIEVSLN